ncbi:unnamed protein product [Prorocentrum cordatum]|uniref:protein-tyrosine-phosphatase n=1 Tax=Prorocentrum cordatum TaxID=2364126 RepID=A0ABN9SRX6_9DINO|nr:unnamed protein product [Polarella glacialis]
MHRWTNVQDHHQYPILHGKDGARSKHLEVANDLYNDVKEAGGKVLFFCVAGQNRSAALAIACLMLHGQPLEYVLKNCSKCRPFILENVGFQRQLVEMEALLKEELDRVHCPAVKKPKVDESRRHLVQALVDSCNVEVELLVPGLCTMDVKIPISSTVASVKKIRFSSIMSTATSWHTQTRQRTLPSRGWCWPCLDTTTSLISLWRRKPSHPASRSQGCGACSG